MVYIRGGETYPDYEFDEKEPVAFQEVVAELHGLPTLRRTMAEIERDISLSMRAEVSHQMSIVRRGPKRFESRFVVDYLDELDDTFNRVGGAMAALAMRQMSLAANHNTAPRIENT